MALPLPGPLNLLRLPELALFCPQLPVVHWRQLDLPLPCRLLSAPCNGVCVQCRGNREVVAAAETEVCPVSSEQVCVQYPYALWFLDCACAGRRRDRAWLQLLSGRCMLQVDGVAGAVAIPGLRRLTIRRKMELDPGTRVGVDSCSRERTCSTAIR